MDLKKLLDEKFSKINDDSKIISNFSFQAKKLNINIFNNNLNQYKNKLSKLVIKYNDEVKKTNNAYKLRVNNEKELEKTDFLYQKFIKLLNNKDHYKAYLMVDSEVEDYLIDYEDFNELFLETENILKSKVKEAEKLVENNRFDEGLEILNSIPLFEGVSSLISKFKDLKEKFLKEQEEQEKQQAYLERKLQLLLEKRKKRKKVLASLLITSIVGATAACLTFTVIIPSIKQGKYNNALNLIEEGKYQEAINQFEVLEFKDSDNQMKVANAGLKFASGNLQEGIKGICDVSGSIVVTYDGDGGKNYLSTETITEDKEITNIPEKESYTFIGWTIESFTFDCEENSYICNLNLKANYDYKKFDIIYNLDGGVNDFNNITTYDLSLGTVNINDPIKKGYTFLGWYDGKETSSNYQVSNLTDNLELTAKWEAKEYDVVVDPDGGNYSDNLNFKIKYDSLVNLQVPTKIGYTFEGWYADKEKLGESWDIDNDSSITIKAKWSTTKFDITYNLDGGQNNSSNPTSITYFDDITILNPTKEGYTFLGWEVNDGSNCVENLIFSDVLNDMKLTAKWKINDYRITFSCEGVDINNQNLDVTYSQKPSLSTPTKLGAVFIGWYYNDVLVDEDWTMPACDITLEGRWSINQYNITYNLDGGTNNSSNPKNITYFDDITVYNPTKEGHTFLGWRVNNGTDFVLEPQFNDILDNITLTAYWEINEYTISFNYNGGDTGVSSIDVLYEDKPNLPIPTKLAYDFIGWYYNDTLVDEDWKMPGNNVTLVAKWEDPFLKYVEYYSGYSGITIKKMKSGYNNTALIVPDKINGKTVYEIKENAFAGLSCVKYLEISNSVSIINYGAFNGMSGLEKIKIPFIGHTKAMASTYMGDWLFGYVFGDGSYQQYTSFYKNGDTVTTSGAYSYGIPLSLKEIIVSGNCYLIRGALSNLYNVEKITFLGSIGRSGVETGAFYNCSSLTELYIPDNTYQIYGLAFSNCTKLTKLSIPSSSIIVSDSAFLNCPATVVYR